MSTFKKQMETTGSIKKEFTEAFNFCWKLLKINNYYLSDNNNNNNKMISEDSAICGHEMYNIMLKIIENMNKKKSQVSAEENRNNLENNKNLVILDDNFVVVNVDKPFSVESENVQQRGQDKNPQDVDGESLEGKIKIKEVISLAGEVDKFASIIDESFSVSDQSTSKTIDTQYTNTEYLEDEASNISVNKENDINLINNQSINPVSSSTSPEIPASSQHSVPQKRSHENTLNLANEQTMNLQSNYQSRKKLAIKEDCEQHSVLLEGIPILSSHSVFNEENEQSLPPDAGQETDSDMTFTDIFYN